MGGVLGEEVLQRDDFIAQIGRAAVVVEVCWESADMGTSYTCSLLYKP